MLYNLNANQWSPSITTPHSLFAMTVLNDELVTAGGSTKNDEVVKKVFVLNAEIPTAICYATAVGYHSMLIEGSVKVKGKWTRLYHRTIGHYQWIVSRSQTLRCRALIDCRS